MLWNSDCQVALVPPESWGGGGGAGGRALDPGGFVIMPKLLLIRGLLIRHVIRGLSIGANCVVAL